MTNENEVPITAEVERLAARLYAVSVTHDEDNGWIGQILELPGHLAVGDSMEEMYEMAEDAKLAWIATAVALNRPVPPPRIEEDVSPKSGKFMVRVAPPIHAAVAQEAERQGISLNELVTNVLTIASTVGLDGLMDALAAQERERLREEKPENMENVIKFPIEERRKVGLM